MGLIRAGKFKGRPFLEIYLDPPKPLGYFDGAGLPKVLRWLISLPQDEQPEVEISHKNKIEDSSGSMLWHKVVPSRCVVSESRIEVCVERFLPNPKTPERYRYGTLIWALDISSYSTDDRIITDITICSYYKYKEELERII